MLEQPVVNLMLWVTLSVEDNFDTLENDQGQYDDDIDVFWTSGACMIIRAKDFNEVGGFIPLFHIWKKLIYVGD